VLNVAPSGLAYRYPTVDPEGAARKPIAELSGNVERGQVLWVDNMVSSHSFESKRLADKASSVGAAAVNMKNSVPGLPKSHQCLPDRPGALRPGNVTEARINVITSDMQNSRFEFSNKLKLDGAYADAGS
jgi:hypothetical protein